MSIQRMRRGTAAVEFALIMPMVIFLLGGILEYGNFFYTKTLAMQAANDGARFGVQILPADDPTGSAVAIAEESLAGYGMDCGGTDCSVIAQITPVSGINVLEVQVTIPHETIFSIVPTPAAAHGNIAMRMEND